MKSKQRTTEDNNQLLISHSDDTLIEDENYFISLLKPELNIVCSNPIRASIVHMLMKNKDLNYTMQVEEISKKIGKRHSVVIYHLERLKAWKVVKVVKSIDCGEYQKRSIWGLNLEYPSLVKEVYGRILKLYYTQKELDNKCTVNKNLRKS